MQGPLVSVIVPCFNDAASIPTCVASLVAQSANIEVVLVDDGSTDDSLSRAAQVMQSAPLRMVVLSQRNQGQAAARNLGMRTASGKYCCFLDVDDELSPGAVNAATQVLESNASIAAVRGGIELINLHRPVEPWQLASMEDTMLGNILIRSDVVREIGGFPIDAAFRGKAAGEDGVFRLQLPRFGTVARIAQPFLRYRVRRGSHVDFFLDRAVRKPDGTLSFTEQSLEEKDGTLHAAFNRYFDGVSKHLLEKVTADIQRELGGGVELLRHHQRLGNGLIDDVDLFEAFMLYTFCRRWPVAGTTLTIGPARGRSTQWLAGACKMAGAQKLVVIDCFPEAQTAASEDLQIIPDAAGKATESWREPLRVLCIPKAPASPNASYACARWLNFIAPFGLVVINRALHLASQTHFAGWKHLLTLQRLAVLQKPND